MTRLPAPAPPAAAVWAAWARLGVLVGAPPAAHTPDPVELLLQTAAATPGCPRLPGLAATWLSRFGDAVNAGALSERLRRERAYGGAFPAAVTGWVLDAALAAGGAASLRGPAAAAGRLSPPRLLFDVDALSPAAGSYAAHEADAASLGRGLYASTPVIRPKVLRPASWVREHNPTLFPRT